MSAKPGRNEPCPCGSGRKHKHCCGVVRAPAAAMLTRGDISALVVLVNQDRFAEAEDASRRLLGLHPGTGMLWKILGVALLRQGKDALQALRTTVDLLPDDAEAHANLGAALHDREEWPAALESLQRALAIQPDAVEALIDAADAMKALGRTREAVPLYERALALRPDHVGAYVGLGIALRRQRRPDDARACADAALGIDPADLDALLLRAELDTDRGRFREAELSFRKAIELDPDNAYAFYSIASQRKLTPDDGTWLRGAEALLARTPTPPDEINIRYALGKYYDDVRDYDRAFDHYRQANELAKRGGAVYDGPKLVRHVDRILGQFDAGFPMRVHARASASTLPVFIIGMPRSGTSLAEQILASHSSVFGAGEITFWDEAFAAYQRAGGEETPTGVALLVDLAHDYLARLTAASDGASRVVDKMPANFLYAGLIHAVFPQARIIHMRRHPLDTCLSVYFQNFFEMGAYANDLDSLAHYYSEYVRITDHWRAVIPATAWLEVPYEGLVAEQERWTRRMLDFLGLPWDRRCLDFHRTNRVVLTSSKWQVRQPLHVTSAGRWRHYEKFIGPLCHLAQPMTPPGSFSRSTVR